jgi:hypothetical protein
MKLKICRCGKEFLTDTKQKYCSDECRRKAGRLQRWLNNNYVWLAARNSYELAEVVRCEDCEYCDKQVTLYRCYYGTPKTVEPDEYCSHGKMRGKA